jgi:hypothetical protein
MWRGENAKPINNENQWQTKIMYEMAIINQSININEKHQLYNNMWQSMIIIINGEIMQWR